METSRTVARQALLDTVKQLEEIVPMVEVDEPLVLNAVTPYMQSFKTTFGREVCREKHPLRMTLTVFSSGLLHSIVCIIGPWYVVHSLHFRMTTMTEWIL